MTIEVTKLLDDYGIEYVKHGKNIGKDYVGMSCFLCGDDPSTHGGLHKETGFYSCWRDESHKMSFAKFVAYQLQIPYKKAKALVYEYSDGTEAPPAPEREEQKLVLPPELERICDGSLNSNFAYKYMKSRGFTDDTMNRFPIYASIVGDFRYRAVIPVYVKEALVAWTGRSVSGEEPRYKSNHPEPGAFPISSYVGFHDNAGRHGGTLFICEGPMDALKLNQFLLPKQGAAICLFGKQLAAHQIELIAKLLKHYERGIVMLDATEHSTSMKMAKELSLYRQCSPFFLEGFKDPGELDTAGFRQLVSKLRS